MRTVIPGLPQFLFQYVTILIMTDMKYIICEDYLKEVLLHKMYQEKREEPGAVRFASLSRLFNEGKEGGSERLLINLSHLLKQEPDAFPVYRNMFRFPAFLQEMTAFAGECALYGINPEDLPADNSPEEELQRIISLALSLPLPEKTLAENREKLLEKTAAKQPVFSFSFEQDIFRYRFLQDLKQRTGSQDIIGKQVTPEKEELRYALSTRQEIEACAQYICKTEIPCNIILTDPSAQLPVLEQIFMRYEIPFSTVRDAFFLKCVPVFSALVRFALNKDVPSLLNAMKLDAFRTGIRPDLLFFARQVMTDIDHEEDISSRLNMTCFPNEANEASRLETELYKYLDAIREDKELLAEADSVYQAFLSAYSILQRHPLMGDLAQLEGGMMIRKILSASLSPEMDEDDAEIVLYLIDSIGVSRRDMSSGLCLVTDLTHPVDARELSFMIGVSSACFPAVPVRKGLFDEDYVRRVPAYPSLEERHAAYIDQLEWVFRSGKHLILSYPTNDYQGRNIELAFEIESRMKSHGVKPSAWVLLQPEAADDPEHSLDEETAGKLFADEEGVIHGSISRFERWFECPYSYFVESGLKIREDRVPGLDAASIGTIQHAFMEEMGNRYGGDFSKVSRQETEEYLSPWFEQLSVLDPNRKADISFTKQRMTDGMMRSLRFLAKAQMDTDFRQEHQEKRFNFDIIAGVNLTGIIDRVDTSGSYFRILDYKSSEHKLSETAVKSGRQLQLLSYVLAYENESSQTPDSAGYFSLQSKAQEEPAGSFKAKGISLNEDVRDPETLERLSDHERRFQGWNFAGSDDEAFDEWFVNPRYDLDAVRKCMGLLYEYFRSHVLAGEIAVDPAETACMFCSYSAVCRNRKGTKKAVPLVMADEPLKGGRK